MKTKIYAMIYAKNVNFSIVYNSKIKYNFNVEQQNLSF